MRRLALLGAFGALLLAGCGTDRIDTARLERELARQIESQAAVAVVKVECPKDVAISTETFECTLRGERGTELKVPVSQDGKGNVRFQTPDLTELRAPPSGLGE